MGLTADFVAWLPGTLDALARLAAGVFRVVAIFGVHGGRWSSRWTLMPPGSSNGAARLLLGLDMRHKLG
jgi:hypothetical protein